MSDFTIGHLYTIMETNKCQAIYKKHFPSMREYRQEQGLSQLELSQLVGVRRQTISDWERGEVFPTDENLKKLAQVFKIDRQTLRKNLEANFEIKQLKKTIARFNEKLGLSKEEVLALIT